MLDCLLCRPADADQALGRIEVWRNHLWRLAVATSGPIAGFAHLEPFRHIPDITQLDGDEAATLGPVLTAVTRALKRSTGAELIYVNVFGERIAHLHFNLAPHRHGGPLTGGPGMLAPGTLDLPAAEHAEAFNTIRTRLQTSP
jgi:diadenosine tetraphosphate (Ap4A) HIT family hydrolase